MSETLPNAKATPEVAFCFLLNQLLEREGWARDRLARFAGQVAELQPPLPLLPPLRFTIAADGRLAPGGSEAPLALVRWNGVAGEGAFADELRYLAKNLRPDIEEELSKIFGDVVAQRIGAAVRGVARWQADAAVRVGEAIAAYAADERGLVVRRIELEALAHGVQALTAALEHVEKRVGRLD